MASFTSESDSERSLVGVWNTRLLFKDCELPFLDLELTSTERNDDSMPPLPPEYVRASCENAITNASMKVVYE